MINKTNMTESMSPVPVKITMSFPDAMQAIIDGKRVRRESWPVGDYGVLEDTFLMIYKDGKHYWTVSEGDLVGTDWIAL